MTADDDLLKGDSFVKVDCGVLDSSLYYRSRRDQRSVFFTALFMAKPVQLKSPRAQLGVRDMTATGWSVPPGWYGLVRASGSAILQRDGIELEQGLAALDALGAKDEDSRSKEFDGRRLVRVNGGYIVLNYFTYRDRDYNAAARMRALRARRQAGDDLFGDENDRARPNESADLTPENVTNSVIGDEQLRNSTQAEAEAEAELQQPKEENAGTGEIVHTPDNGVRPLPAIHGKRNLVAIRDRLVAVISELQTGARERLRKEQIRTLQAEMLFGYWQAKFNKPRAWLDDKREKLLVRRLEENKGDVSELFYVLDGALSDDWVTGKSDKARHANDGIEYIFRDRAHVERFASRCRGYRDDKPHKMAEKYAAIFADIEPPRQLGAGGSEPNAE